MAWPTHDLGVRGADSARGPFDPLETFQGVRHPDKTRQDRMKRDDRPRVDDARYRLEAAQRRAKKVREAVRG